ncbi:MAG: NifU family protein [Cyclobacteriaceae bacterium]|nr:NifU family protein [Cyclobacteriaceae bacterium]MCK5281612.1 NifU family protein [Cyclobacteriaceae bacterium]MCK5370384.1 NifU family protein [Cyclobacteriaceae bacterium]MCK5468656.1 NifU family protein [Cyclobacteriaceae bacterium]MCK5700897.1 NifU family protein [Cyclobacteriaceae bacterium]
MENKSINIYLEANPNPNSLKFVADYMLVEPGQNYDFPDLESAEIAPLAAELFGYDYVQRVFYMSNFITVTKTEDKQWMEIQDELKEHIKTFLESGKPILKESALEEKVVETEMDVKIMGILDEYIKPAVEQDGGAIEYRSFEDGIVKVYLQGACSGCPSATVTLKSGIENLLKSMIPEVKAVEAEEV